MTTIAEQIKEKMVFGNSLRISRVPEKTLSQFIELSKEDFCDDRGMTLKFLMDLYMGVIPTGVEHIEIEIEQLKSRMTVLENKEEKKEVKVIKMASGKELRRV